MVKRITKVKTIILTSVLILIPLLLQSQTGILKGTVTDSTSGLPLHGVNVLLFGTTQGAATDSLGRYTIQNIPAGIYTVRFSMIGYEEIFISDYYIQPGENQLKVTLTEAAIEIQEILVTPKPERYDATGISARLNREMIAGAPGSAQDIFWVIQTLPGISSDADNSKLYVRGGSPEENLIVYDGITIRNPYHFDMIGGGYWSIFNSRLVENVEFYSGGFPARYGDRLSSVLVIENRTGNFELFQGEASLSMSDASGVLELPLPFANGAALLSFRRSYFDLAIKYTDLAGDYDILPYFYDINSRFDFILSDNHRLTISGLFSREKFYGYFDRTPQLTGDYNWGSKNYVIGGRLRSIVTQNILSDLVISLNDIKYSSTYPQNAFDSSSVTEFNIKQNFTFLSPSNELHIGGWLVSERENNESYIPLELALNMGVDEMRWHGRVPVHYLNCRCT